MSMKISTLSIGDELLSGEVLDTNASHIASSLYSAGLEVFRHITVKDSESGISDAIKLLSGISDILIVTGGLGPTVDDLTARGAARALGLRLVLNDDALRHIRTFRSRMGENLSPSNDRQALLPERCEIMQNRCGTASGFILKAVKCTIFFMPGVPSEMRMMLEEEVMPVIRRLSSIGDASASSVFRIFGIPESGIADIVEPLMENFIDIQTAYRVDFPDVLLKLRCRDYSTIASRDALKIAHMAVREALGLYVVSEDGSTIEKRVLELLKENGLRISTAESCTGGLIASVITSVPGSSSCFSEGVVVYSNDAKIKHLSVSSETMENFGAVSRQTASEMASGLLSLTKSDICLSVTGIAGPDGGTESKPVGTVFIALATCGSTRIQEFHFGGSRDEIRQLAVSNALDMVRRYLLCRK